MKSQNKNPLNKRSYSDAKKQMQKLQTKDILPLGVISQRAQNNQESQRVELLQGLMPRL